MKSRKGVLYFSSFPLILAFLMELGVHTKLFYPPAIQTQNQVITKKITVAPHVPFLRQEIAQIGNLSYSSTELFQPISYVDSTWLPGGGHGYVMMHRGYLFTPAAREGVVPPNGVLNFVDISDPRNPFLHCSTQNSLTEDLREPHGYGMSYSYDGKDLLAMQTVLGFKIFDITDICNPILLSNVDAPGVDHHNYGGNWWLFFQAPYIFHSAWENGVYIYDASDPTNPVLVNTMSKSFLGGIKAATTLVVGNLLFTGDRDVGKIAIVDVSDPLNPVLLNQIPALQSYAWMVNGNKIYGAGVDAKLHVYDFSDPTNIQYDGSSEEFKDKGGYLTVQDDYVFCGFSKEVAKINKNDLSVAGVATSGVRGRDEDFAVVLGNLIFSGNDHDPISYFTPHQEAPDTQGPAVTMVSPQDGATDVYQLARIGLTLSDNIDLATADTTTFIVRPQGGLAINGKYSYQTGILNFSPEQTLLPNTTYEVIVPACGIEDISGNCTGIVFSSSFTTGEGLVVDDCTIASEIAEVGTSLSLSLQTSSSSSNLTYTWDLGDGSAPVSTTLPTVSHIYTDPGTYLVDVEIKEGENPVAICQKNQVIVNPLSAGEPEHSRPIILTEDGSYIVNVNPDNHTISVTDAETLTKISEIAVGKRPKSLAEDADGNIWVVNQDDYSISILSLSTNTILQTLPLTFASQPIAICFAPNKDQVYVSLSATGELLKIDPTTRSITSSLNIGMHARAIAITDDGQNLYVTSFISPENSGIVTKVDLNTFTTFTTIPLAIDPGPDAPTSGRGLPNYLVGATISPDGSELWVPSKKDNLQRGLLRDGQALTFENTVRAISSVIDIQAGSELLNKRIDYNNSDSPSAIEFSELGNVVFTAIQGNDLVEARDPQNGELLAVLENTGQAPQGLVYDKQRKRLYVHGFLSRSVEVIDVGDIVLGLGTIETKLATIPVVANENLTSEVLLGKQIFYLANDVRMGTDSYISCASCHLDGGQDGQNWDFLSLGEGIRNNISLKGKGGMTHGRVHWTGNFDEIQDFESQIRFLAEGHGFLPDAAFFSDSIQDPLGATKAGYSGDLDVLAAYVASLDEFEPSPNRPDASNMTAGGQAGATIFMDLGCGNCHSGESFTASSENNLLHDVGTLGANSGSRLGESLLGLDVPTLKGLWASAPYLHDGSAATLYDVLETANPEDKHGAISSLSNAEIDQLVEYLLQLDDNSVNGTPSSPYAMEILVPSEAATWAAGQALDLAISHNFSDLSSLVFYIDGTEVGTLSSAPFIFSWTPNSEGVYEIAVKAFHNSGKYASVAYLKLTVSENQPLVISSFEAIEDAYVKAADQNGNFGSVNELRLKNNGNFSHVTFIKFNVGQLLSVNQATLRLYPSASSKLISVGVFESESSWTEGTITAGNAPAQGTLLGELDIQNVNDPLELDVSAYTATVLSSQTTIAFRIESTNPNKDVGLISSRESGLPAELILQSGGSHVNQPPTALIQTNALAGTAPLLIDFDGLGSTDPDGTIESYAWDFGDGGTSKLPQTAHPFNTAGTYLVSLVVADDEGAKDTAEVTITVTEPVPNTAPTASFMADPVSGTVPLTVNLDASASSDSDGTIATYAWDLGDGNTGSGNPASHTFTSVGIFNVQLIVTDNEGAKDTTNQEITVNEESGPVNVPPTATFTADPLPGTAPLVVNFDATASSDSDGTITSYTWDFGDGNTGSGNASSHSFSNAGTYTVILTVTDNEGATGTSSQSITVNEDSGPGTTTILTAIDDAYIRLNKGNNNYGSTGFMNLKNNGNYSHESYIKFDAGATQGVNNALLRLFPSPGTEQVIIEVYGSSSNWNEGSITANNAPGSQTLIISHTMTSTSATIELDVGAYVQNTLANEPEVSFHLVSGNPNKDIGQIGTKEGGLPAELVIETGSGPGPSNVPPVAEILAVPTNGEAPLTVSLDGSGSSDIDGTIATYAWDFGDGNTGSGAITSHEYLNPGIFTATLRVTDDQGASGTATESITVTAPIGNLPPTALFSYDPPSGIVPLNVNFDGSASSDSDGSIASYEWVFGDGTTGSGEAISHQYTTVGSFTVELTVTDDQGATTSASHAVTVNEVGGPSTTVTLGAIEDSYVKLAKANSNYGSAQEMRLKDNGSFSFQGYIKFDAGSPQQVSTATLRMYPKSGTSLISVGVNASSDGWFESSIVGSNAPASQGTLGDLDISSSNDPLELDVTSYVAGILSTQASIAFQIVSTNGNKDIGLIGTKEGGLGAELEITTDGSNVPSTFSSFVPILKENPKPFSYEIFPNPFSGTFLLKWEGSSQNGVLIQLRDVNGKRILSRNIDKNEFIGSMKMGAELSSGVYILQIMDGSMNDFYRLIKID